MKATPLALVAGSAPLLTDCIASALELAGYRAVAVTTYAAAKDILLTQSPHLVVCDPLFHDGGVLELVAATRPSLPLVVVTDDSHDGFVGALLPHWIVLSKPFGKDELIDAIQRAQIASRGIGFQMFP